MCLQPPVRGFAFAAHIQLLRHHHKKFEKIYFCISNFAPNDFIIFKKDGEEVKTVSKFLILAFAPVNIAKTKDDIQILWSPKFEILIVLLFPSIIPFPKIFNSFLVETLFTPI